MQEKESFLNYNHSDFFTSVEKETDEEESFLDYNHADFFTSPEEQVKLEDIDYSTRAAYGAAQETTIGGNIFRMAKAAVTAGTSDESWTEALANLEKERQKEIDMMFPRLANLEESEEDLAILSGRLGVAVADPTTFFMPWLKAAKVGSTGARIAKTAAAYGATGAADTALREKVIYGDVDLTNVGIATAVGAGSSVLGLGAKEGINFARNKFKVAKSLEDLEPGAVAKQETNLYADLTDLNQEEALVVNNTLKKVLEGTDDDLLSISNSNSFIPEYRAALVKIDAERAELNKLAKADDVTEEQTKDITKKLRDLTNKKTALNKKLKQDTINLSLKKDEVNLKALEELAKTEGFTAKAGRAILSNVGAPVTGAIGGSFFGVALRDDPDDTSSIYTSMLVGAGLGVAARKIRNSQVVPDVNKETAEMVLDEAAKKNISNQVKVLIGDTTSDRMEQFGGWNKTIGSLLLQKFGSNVDSIEGRTLRKQSEWVGIINDRAGKSGKDNDVLEVVGESLFGFAPDNLVGYKGIRGDLKPLTQEQADEVIRITPLYREAQEAIKERAGKSGIKYEDLDFYGMSVRHNYSKTKNAQQLEAHRKDLIEAVKIHNKNLPEGVKKLSPTSYANGVLDINTSKEGKYVPSGRGPSPFVYDKKGKIVKFRKAAEFFESERKLTDPEALKYLASKNRLVLNSRDVLSDYGSTSLKVFEFADVMGPNGEVINLALNDIRKAFSKAKKTLVNKESGETYTKQLTDTIEAYWGGYSHGGEDIAKKTISVYTTLANTAYLTGVSLANIVDLANPIIKSGVWPTIQTIMQKGTKKSKSQISHFKYDQSYDRELETLFQNKPVNQQGKIARVTDFTNKNFFFLVGLKKVNNIARNFAYDVGVNRAYNLSKKKKFSRVDINEIRALGLNVDDMKAISKYSNVEEAFEKTNARSLLDIAGREAAERDAIVPNVSNRLLFTQSNTPIVKATGQFLSWSQGKSSEANAMLDRIEDGDVKTLIRLGAAIPILTGYEQLRQYITSNDSYYDREESDEPDDTAQVLADGARRSGLLMNWKRDWLLDALKYNTGLFNGRPEFNATDSFAPAFAFFEELGTSAVKTALNIAEGDVEGALKTGIESGIVPFGKPILKIIKSATGKPLLVDEKEDNTEEVKKLSKGGEVDIPRAASEPDERIDKMTGMPYDQQAGTAFVDEEDPLRRMGFGRGGEVDPLKRMGFGGVL